MNIFKSLLGKIVAKAIDEMGLKINEKKAAEYLKNVQLERITKAELADWLDQIIEGKTLSEPLSDIGIHQALNEIEAWAKDKIKE